MVNITQAKWTVRMALESNPDVKLTLQVDLSMSPAQQMTSLLFARDLFRSEILKSELNFKFMFDEHNPTVEDEIVAQQLDNVLIKPVALGDQTALKNLAPSAVHIQLAVNQKKQLTRIVELEKKGRVMQMHQVVNFNIDELPQAFQHAYTGKVDKDKLKGVQRVKVPVKDGQS